MSDNKESALNNLKELNDLEFELLFVDNFTKKVKAVLDKQDARTATLLLVYYSLVESLKKYKTMSSDDNRTIAHEDVIDLIITKSESFLSNVAFNEEKAPYAFKSLSDIYELMKGLSFMLKKELVESPEYLHLKS